MRRVIYTAIFGDELPLRLWEPLVIPPETDFFCFTDQPVESNVWHIHREERCKCPTLAARTVKILSHDHFPDAETTLWMDSRFQLIADPFEAAERYEPWEVLAFEHPDRDNLVDEAAEIARLNKAPEQALQAQLKDYLGFGHGQRGDMKHLTATGFLMRNNTPAVASFNSLWLDELLQHTLRDQMSVDFAAASAGVAIQYLPGNYRENKWTVWSKGTK